MAPTPNLVSQQASGTGGYLTSQPWRQGAQRLSLWAGDEEEDPLMGGKQEARHSLGVPVHDPQGDRHSRSSRPAPLC
jgi:hypothetical protein